MLSSWPLTSAKSVWRRIQPPRRAKPYVDFSSHCTQVKVVVGYVNFQDFLKASTCADASTRGMQWQDRSWGTIQMDSPTILHMQNNCTKVWDISSCLNFYEWYIFNLSAFSLTHESVSWMYLPLFGLPTFRFVSYLQSCRLRGREVHVKRIFIFVYF